MPRLAVNNLSKKVIFNLRINDYYFFLKHFISLKGSFYLCWYEV